MAKKILKRSLALGALMAFVITGSAMAEEPFFVKKVLPAPPFKNFDLGIYNVIFILWENFCKKVFPRIS